MNDHDSDPKQLLEGGDGTPDHAALSALLRRLPEPSAEGLDLQGVWQQVGRPSRRATGRRWVVALGSLALAGGGAALAVLAFHAPTSGRVAAGAQARLELVTGQVSIAAAGTGAPRDGTVGATLEQSGRIQTGADGRTIFDVARARVLLSPDTRLELAALGTATSLRLGSGALLADVGPRGGGESFEVKAGRTVVTIKGTLFRVQVGAEDEVSVSCTRGSVEVSGIDGTRRIVAAGDSWVSTQPDATLADNTPEADRRLLEGQEPPEDVGPKATEDSARVEPPPTPRPTERPRLALAEPQTEKSSHEDLYASALAFDRRGQHQEAAAILRQIVARRLTNSDLALYHLAQLEQGPLGDSSAAEHDYQRYEHDYPQGALAQEAELSAIELQLQRSAFPEALEQMARFLRDHPTSERGSKVHVLRGNVLRAQGNAQAALAEYSQVQGAEADDALYFSALCQRALGKPDAVTSALHGYLTRYPTGRHAAEARTALAQ